jgi:hypothetical protein
MQQAISLFYSHAHKHHPVRGHAEGFPAHIAHCFDYLRQAILCAADTNLEPVKPELYGANTAIPKKCRDIKQVSEWAEKWKSPLAKTKEFERRLDLIRGFEESIY